MQGRSIERRLERDPDLADAWELYQLCRQQQLIIFEKPTGKKDGSKTLASAIWPTGFSSLPDGHGVFNEDYLLMRYFHGFLVGEREGAVRMISHK